MNLGERDPENAPAPQKNTKTKQKQTPNKHKNILLVWDWGDKGLNVAEAYE